MLPRKYSGTGTGPTRTRSCAPNAQQGRIRTRIGTSAISPAYGSRGAPSAPSGRNRRAASSSAGVSSVCQRGWAAHEHRSVIAAARMPAAARAGADAGENRASIDGIGKLGRLRARARKRTADDLVMQDLDVETLERRAGMRGDRTRREQQPGKPAQRNAERVTAGADVFERGDEARGAFFIRGKALQRERCGQGTFELGCVGAAGGDKLAV